MTDFGFIVVDDPRQVHGCDLAWSGSQLLVAWWQLERAEDGTPTSMVLAKLVDVSR